MSGKIIYTCTYREQDFPGGDFFEDYKLARYLREQIPTVVWGDQIGAINAGEGNICIEITTEYQVDKR